jgi:hypothetical protein
MSWNRTTLQGVAIKQCILNQLTVGEVTLAGSLTIDGCWVLLSDLVGLHSTEGTVSDLLHIRNSDLFYCRLDRLSSQAADRGPDNRRYPDPSVMGSEPSLRDLPRSMEAWRQPV